MWVVVQMEGRDYEDSSVMSVFGPYATQEDALLIEAQHRRLDRENAEWRYSYDVAKVEMF